jgi:hypothetical protein
MARTRIKSSDIENLTISAVDIDTNSISNDKIIGIEADKLTGTLLASTFPATLPAIDGSALTGEVNANRFPATLPAIDGSALTGEVNANRIAINSISNDKIIGIEANKLTGTLLASTFPATLPAIDGSALSNVSVDSSGIPDNAISLNQLNVSGTTGQFLSIDNSNNLVFDDLTNALSGASQLSSSNIADNSIGIPQINIADGTTGQVISRNGSGNLQFIDVVSDPTMGGDLSGLASAASLNNNTVSQDNISPGSIDDSKIIGLDASKLFGTAPFNTVGGGELGFLNKSNWLDEEKVTVSLDNSAPGIGKAVVRVFEEFLDPATQNISSGSDWDITTNDAGFNLYNYASAASVTCTPAAITGKDINFTFANTSPFTGTDYNDAVGYKITKLNGPGVARIKSTLNNGLTALCDIEVDFDNTDTMTPGGFKLESGEFIDGNFTPSSSVSNSIVPFFGLGGDVGGSVIEDGKVVFVRIDDDRAIRLVSRIGSNAFQGQSTQMSLRIIQHDPNSTQGSGITANQEFIFQSTTSSGRFPVLNESFLSDCDICFLSDRGAVVVGKDSSGNCRAIGMHIPGVGSANITDPNNNPQTIVLDPTGTNFFQVSSSSSCKDMIIKPLSTKHFVVMWTETINFSGGGSGPVPKLKIGYMEPNGTIIMNGLEKLLFSNDGGGADGFSSTPGDQNFVYAANSAGAPNKPILQMFNHESSDARRDFLYLYYRDDGRPYGVHGTIEDFNKNTNSVPVIRYNRGNEMRPNGGHFRDSNDVLLTNTGANNRISTGDYTHWIDAIDQKTAVYFWRDSVLGVQAACVSLGKAGGPPFGNRSIFIGDYFSTGANSNTNITSGPATRLDAITGTANAGVGAMSGAIYDQTLRAGYYQWSDHRSGVPIGEAASDVIYGTFIESNTSIIKTTPSNPLTYSVSGDVSSHAVVVMNNNRMISAHEHGDHNYYARIYNFEQQLYVSGEYIIAITGNDSLDTTDYTEITSITGIVGGSGNGSNSFYAFCTNPTYDVFGNILTGGTFFISRNGAARRNIATSEASLHGGTEGDWYHNNGSGTGEVWIRSVATSTFPQNIDKNNPSIALSEALRANIGENGMSLSNLNNDNPFGGTWPALGTTFAAAIMIDAANTTNAVQVDKLNVIYNAGGLRHRDKTQDYTIDIVDIDNIELTAPINPDGSGNRNARIFVSS